MNHTIFLFLITFLLVSSCKPNQTKIPNDSLNAFTISNPQATSLLGKKLSSPKPSENLTKRYQEKKNQYQRDSVNAENIIWFGRFTAYMGDYLEAIKIYSKGISLFPEDARFYRHRGHRYISIRKFDEAISDFEKARSLIQGKENQVEPDGMPNDKNIPVSTLHGNIYYHLGLAYYLKGNLEEAHEAYLMCLKTSRMPDNIVSASHWLYMINRLRDEPDLAESFVKDIKTDDDIIENHSYHRLCLLYNGTSTEDQALQKEKSFSANDAVTYGVANWHVYNQRTDKGYNMMNEMMTGTGWASFGYIAAEADLARLNK